MNPWAGLVLATLALPAQALDLALPEGTNLALETRVEAGRYAVPTGPARLGEVPVRQIEGALRHRVWHLDPPLPIDVLLATLRTQLEAAGYRVIYDCTTEACGGFDFRFALQDAGPPDMMVDLGRYGYLAGQHAGADGYAVLLLSRMQGLGYLQLTEIRPGDIGVAEPLATVLPDEASGLTQAAPGSLAETLLSTGRAVLDDLRFATGDSALEDGPYASLAELAGILTENPDLALALVGHTDSEGSTEANLALSLRRAQAVEARLVTVHGISRDRVRAEGIGYLAPRATNRTDAGRRANRRVEAVLTQP